jgi:hypothetical protein
LGIAVSLRSRKPAYRLQQANLSLNIDDDREVAALDERACVLERGEKRQRLIQ